MGADGGQAGRRFAGLIKEVAYQELRALDIGIVKWLISMKLALRQTIALACAMTPS